MAPHAGMPISIELVGNDSEGASSSLYNHLRRDDYINTNSRPSLQAAEADPQGLLAALQVIQLTLDVGFMVQKLVTEIISWWNSSHRTETLRINAGGISRELSSADMADREKVELALAGIPDPRRSSCVLIAVDGHQEATKLPAARRNVEDLRAAFTDPGIWGIPSAKVHKIVNPGSLKELTDIIGDAAEEADDALIVYYAGHGRHDKKSGLLLTLPGPDQANPVVDVEWNHLAGIIQDAHVARRIVILDCCYSGLAAKTQTTPPPALSEAAKRDRTYILAASAENAPALSPVHGDCTAFTGALIDVLRKGVVPGPPRQRFITLDKIYNTVWDQTSKKHYPLPQQSDDAGIGKFPQFNNAAPEEIPLLSRIPLPARKTSKQPSGNYSGRGIKSVIGSAITVAIVAVATILYLHFSPPSHATRVSGAALAGYCEVLNNSTPGGDGSSCIQPINLDKACNWQYGATGLHAKFADKGSFGAQCVNSAGVIVHPNGISDMTGYCRTAGATGAANATASPVRKGSQSWLCTVQVNMNDLCNSQNNSNGLFAKNSGTKENPDWGCFRP